MHLIRKRPKNTSTRPRDYSCKSAISLLGEYLSGSLNSRVGADLDRHLSQCPDCAAFLKTYKKTIEVTQSFLKLQAIQNRPRKLSFRAPSAEGIVK